MRDLIGPLRDPITSELLRNTTFSIETAGAFADASSSYPAYFGVITTDDDGDFATTLGTPTNGTAAFTFRIPQGGVPITLNIDSGADTTLHALIAAQQAVVPPDALATETLARIAADATLQTGITTEATARANADTAHGAAGDPHPQYETQAEADARYWPQSTDLATQVELDAEATTRAAADTTLQTNITSEATARATADSTHAALTTAAHGGIVASSDARLTDSRTPTAHAIGGALHTGSLTDALHGSLSGGALHANVVAAGAAGFMTGADKTKLDGIAAGATAIKPPLAMSFSQNGDIYFVAHEAMTLTTPQEAGTGTLVYTRALAASPTSFSTLTFPGTLAVGDIVKVTLTGISGYKALTAPRSA